MNKKLNSKLWQDKELIPEVKEKLLEIVDNFIENLKEDEIELKLKDIVIVGSNANFNYTSESDIDLHIIADMSDIEDEEEKRLLIILYNAYKSLFNTKFEIIIKGITVEVYVEPDETQTQSGGVYSLIDGWIKFPEESSTVKTDVTSNTFETEFSKWKARFDEIMKSFPDTFEIDDAKLIVDENLSSKEETQLADIEKFLEDIYEERKKALAKDGEESSGNKVFKEFRRLGHLRTLKALKIGLESKKMSLESLRENVKDITDEELFWHLRDGLVDVDGDYLNETKYSSRAKLILDSLSGNIVVEKGMLDILPNPDKGFAVSPEQYDSHLLSKTLLLEFKDAVKGERVMFYNSIDEYGSEYSVLTQHQDLCIKACRGELGPEFAKQREYAEYKDGEYIPRKP